MQVECKSYFDKLIWLRILRLTLSHCFMKNYLNLSSLNSGNQELNTVYDCTQYIFHSRFFKFRIITNHISYIQKIICMQLQKKFFTQNAKKKHIWTTQQLFCYIWLVKNEAWWMVGTKWFCLCSSDYTYLNFFIMQSETFNLLSYSEKHYIQNCIIYPILICAETFLFEINSITEYKIWVFTSICSKPELWTTDHLYSRIEVTDHHSTILIFQGFKYNWNPSVEQKDLTSTWWLK